MSKISVTATIALSLVSAMAVAANAAPKYQPFPDGYGYMDTNEISALAVAVAAGDHKTVRDHGWKLWAGIMQPDAGGKWPIWYTWPNTQALFAPSGTRVNATLAANAGPAGSLIELNALDAPDHVSRHDLGEIPVNVKVRPYYPLPAPVVAAYPKVTNTKACGGQGSICKGAHFLFNGDIMIPTETLSQEGFDSIRDQKLYEQATLNALRSKDTKDLSLPERYIVTKHKFWPVKAGRISAIPVWHDYHDASYRDYAGYETWPDMVGVDPSGRSVGTKVTASYLYGVFQYDRKTPWPTQTATVTVYGLKDFYYHQVTEEDWNSFDEADKAILNAASYWANNEPFGPGDYLVTIAMHVNTKEIATWALQSVWWSDRPNAGRFAEDRPSLPQAKGPWDHYLLVDGYGIADPLHKDRVPVATNPYIELTVHPVGTDCNNCHMRAGWPKAKRGEPAHPGEASYQNPDCPDSLAKLSPESPCLEGLTRSDFQWIIPDRAIPAPK